MITPFSLRDFSHIPGTHFFFFLVWRLGFPATQASTGGVISASLASRVSGAFQEFWVLAVEGRGPHAPRVDPPQAPAPITAFPSPLRYFMSIVFTHQLDFAPRKLNFSSPFFWYSCGEKMTITRKLE